VKGNMQYTRFLGAALVVLSACGPSAPVQEAKEPKAETQTTGTTPLPAEGSSESTPAAAAKAPSADPAKDPAKAPAADEAQPPKRIGARHVLVQWMGADKAPSSVVRSKEQARAIIEEVHRRAKAGEDFARLAVDYSDEPGAGNRGGSLGRFGKGQMVGQFESVAFKLKVNEISEIVETGFGYHVIQRTE
jgi:hypothetical protein